MRNTPPKTMIHSKLAPLLALSGVWYGGKSAVILDFEGFMIRDYFVLLLQATYPDASAIPLV